MFIFSLYHLWVLMLSPVLIATVVMAVYVVIKRHTFVADLQRSWRWQWYLFLVFTLFSPLNWLVYTISIVRVHRYKPIWEEWEQQRREDRDRENVRLQEECNREAEARRRQEEAMSKIAASDLPSYSGSPGVGEAAYIDMLVRHGTHGTKQKREKLRQQEAEIANSLRRLQAELNETRAEVANCDEVVAKFLDNLNEEEVAKEFKKLLDLSAVLAVRVVNDQMRLVIRCQAEVEGELYDLGDWYLWVDMECFRFRTELIRDGRRPDISGHSEPPHINEDGTFCFGSREEELCDLVKRGQVFAALTVAMNYMCQTIPGRENRLPKVYRQITT